VVVYVYGGDPRLQKQDIENNQSIKRKMWVSMVIVP
jgi:hypothetical protein